MTAHPSDSLQVFAVQAASTLEPEENRQALAGLMPQGRADLVVFPEAFQREFGDPGAQVAADAEAIGGPFDSELTRLADAHHTTAVAGMFELADTPTGAGEKAYNTLLVRGATTAVYRKIHLYDSFGYKESDALRAGEWSPTVIDINGWRVGLMTCYDLRFPELARDLVSAGAEVLVLPAAWVAGERKVHHWRTLAQARAIENVCFVVAVDQPGPKYAGHTLAVGPLGDVLVELDTEPGSVEVTLQRADLDAARRTNPSLHNRRR